MALTTSQIASASEKTLRFNNVIESADANKTYKLLNISPAGYYKIYIKNSVGIIQIEILNNEIFSIRSGGLGAFKACLENNYSENNSLENSSLFMSGISGNISIEIVSSIAEVTLICVEGTPSTPSSLVQYSYGKEYLIQEVHVDTMVINTLQATKLDVNELKLNSVKLGDWTITINDDNTATIK